MATSIQIGSLPIDSIYINNNMLGPDNKPIRWKIIDKRNAEQLVPSVTLQSETIYWGQQFEYNHWDSSELRTYLNSTALNGFLNKFTPESIGQILPHESKIYYVKNNAGAYTSTTDKIRISNLGRTTGDYFFQPINNFYAQAVIDIRETTLVYNSNGEYHDVNGLAKPIITTYIPNDNMGMIFGPTNINYMVSNPNNTSSLSVSFVCKDNGYTLASYDNLQFNTQLSLQMSQMMFDGMVGNSKIIIKATDGLGVSNTKEISYSKTANGPIVSSGDFDFGIQNNHLWSKNKVVTITDANSSTVNVRMYMDDVLIKGPISVASGANFDITVPTDAWDSLATGEHVMRLMAYDSPWDGTSIYSGSFTNRYWKFNKSAVTMTITSNQPNAIGKIASPLNLIFSVLNSDITHGISLVYKIDNVQVDTLTLSTSANNMLFTIPTNTWRSLSTGEHTLSINATDTSVTSVTASAVFTFIKTDTAIIVRSKPKNTINMAKTIAVNTNAELPMLSNYKIMVCNNANDTRPYWEDMTTEFLNNKTYTFKNSTKTSTNWAISIDINITKDNSQGKCSLFGFGYYWSE